ncbi:hypothetical protein [Vineibacter terrae]|uniref:hypothetical protein n=1 Tax=Vineibacter terrae TaxID=2586908 RepID=UPI0015B6847C|nr:hypothetical protein [Vineibacter terrae]
MRCRQPDAQSRRRYQSRCLRPILNDRVNLHFPRLAKHLGNTNLATTGRRRLEEIATTAGGLAEFSILSQKPWRGLVVAGYAG